MKRMLHGSRHALKPISSKLTEIILRGLGHRQHPPPKSCSAAAPPLHRQPHISSFHLRYCHLTIRLTEAWPILKASWPNYYVCTLDERPIVCKQGAMFSGKTTNRPENVLQGLFIPSMEFNRTTVICLFVVRQEGLPG